MTTEKVVLNYTEEQTVQMVDAYKAGNTVEDIAAALGKSVRSVIAKLSREKVYIKPATSTSTRITKADLVSVIAAKVGSTKEALVSMEKMDKPALEILVKYLQ